VCDEVAWFEHGFAIRCAAGQKMKVTNGDRARTVRSLHVNRRFQCRHRDAHVRGIGCDAVFAGSQDSEHAIGTGDRRAASSGFSFIARHGSRVVPQ
jgi:hypothetical protein